MSTNSSARTVAYVAKWAVPAGSQQAFDHGCGSNICYIQRPAAACSLDRVWKKL